MALVARNNVLTKNAYLLNTVKNHHVSAAQGKTIPVVTSCTLKNRCVMHQRVQSLMTRPNLIKKLKLTATRSRRSNPAITHLRSSSCPNIKTQPYETKNLLPRTRSSTSLTQTHTNCQDKWFDFLPIFRTCPKTFVRFYSRKPNEKKPATLSTPLAPHQDGSCFTFPTKTSIQQCRAKSNDIVLPPVIITPPPKTETLKVTAICDDLASDAARVTSAVCACCGCGPCCGPCCGCGPAPCGCGCCGCGCGPCCGACGCGPGSGACPFGPCGCGGCCSPCCCGPCGCGCCGCGGCKGCGCCGPCCGCCGPCCGGCGCCGCGPCCGGCGCCGCGPCCGGCGCCGCGPCCGGCGCGPCCGGCGCGPCCGGCGCCGCGGCGCCGCGPCGIKPVCCGCCSPCAPCGCGFYVPSPISPGGPCGPCARGPCP